MQNEGDSARSILVGLLVVVALGGVACAGSDGISGGAIPTSPAAAASPPPPTGEAFDSHASSAAQRARIDAARAALAPVIASRKDPKALLLLDLPALYAPLSQDDRALLDALRRLPGADPTVGIPEDVEWVVVDGQIARTPDGARAIPLQLLTAPVARAFRDMDRAMRAELGRGLLVGSAYRSPAYQLWLIVEYLPRFDYSLEQTLPHVSLPGGSDHNRVDRLGIDFVSETGVDLAYSDPVAFTALPEWDWLLANAARFGFEPEPVGEGEPITSPWHWRFVGEPAATGR